MRLSKMQANLMLLACAVIWGFGYVVVKAAINAHVPAGLMVGIRGLIYMGLAYLFFHQAINHMKKRDFWVGFIAGAVNFVAYLVQTIGLQYTTPSNNAFLTAIYVVIVPFIMWLWQRQRPERRSYIAIALCLLGMVFLTNMIQVGLHFQLGDFLTVVSAFIYAAQIVYFGSSAADASPWVISFMLGLTQAVGGLAWSVCFEISTYHAINWPQAIMPLLVLGVLSSFGAQTLQVVGQRFTDPTPAGLILMTEAMFGSFFSVLLGFEPITANLVIGGALIISALLLTQLDFKKIQLPRR